MSDFSNDPYQQPAPPAPAPPPPPMGGYPPAPGMMPGMMPGMAPQKPPRPAVTVGAALMVAGGALLILGSFLNWFTIDDGFENVKYNGFSGEDGDTKDGPVFVFFGVLAIGFGVAMLAAKRMLAVAILGVIFAVLAVLAAFVDLGDVSDAKELAKAFDIGFKQGPGLWVVLLGGLLALAGSIAALAKRRR